MQGDNKISENQEFGAPPKTGWAKLVSELLVEDSRVSLSFWRDLIGFEIAYQRPDQGFVYLERPEGAQIMLCERSSEWETAALERPFGRGVMFQVYVEDVNLIYESILSAKWPIYAPMREVWRRHGDRNGGQREFFVQDPDGYLVMVAQSLGVQPIS